MNEFNPRFHHVGLWRLCRTPAEGKILRVEQLEKLELAFYAPREGPAHWRILEPENPVSIDRIEIERAEGPIDLCGKRVVCRPELRRGNGDPESCFCDDWVCGAFASANTTFLIWGATAPKDGGYDKCDFEIFWRDGSHYQGRYDLEYGGKESGEDFHTSFASRLRFYAGLGPTPAPFYRKNAVEQYSEQEARDRYLQLMDKRGMIAQARDMLATLEL